MKFLKVLNGKVMSTWSHLHETLLTYRVLGRQQVQISNAKASTRLSSGAETVHFMDGFYETKEECKRVPATVTNFRHETRTLEVDH